MHHTPELSGGLRPREASKFRAKAALGWIIVVNEAARLLAKPQNVRDSDTNMAASPIADNAHL
jgi:hypothetical protein